MLVLTRKPGEEIVIGENIVITVVRVQGDKVRLGISAPPHVNIVRGELLPHGVTVDTEEAELVA